MNLKITALLLLATALPFTQAIAHTGSLKNAPINGYLYFMVGIGAIYFVYLLVRTHRKGNKIK